MTFEEIVDQAIEMVRRRGRVTYRMLKRQFDLDDEVLEDLKEELIYGQRLAIDEDDRALVWIADTASASLPSTASGPASEPTAEPKPLPISYTPSYLTEKILTSRSAMEGERKQVTVLFADIKDSTELIRDLDPEEAQQLLDPAIHIMMEAVHRFEGTVNQVLGDGIMSIFGAPIAHEDHALRACYAALAMQNTMRTYTEDMRRTHGMPLQIRAGLNSGEVVVRTISSDLHMDYSAVGQATHLAARLEQLATPGTIILSRATLRLVEGLVQVNALGPTPVKGMTEPVEVFELTGASSIRRRLQAAAARGLTKFVGRDIEIEALNQALEQARTGHGQIVATVGEAGVGKSRLVYEFIHSHRTQGWRVLESASVSYGKATPYFPVIDLLKRYVHIEDGDDGRTIRAKLTGHILTLDETLQETIPALLSLLDALPEDSPFLQLDPPQRRQRTLDGLKRILLRESQVQPLLLVFEDLHWHDSESQVLLDRLVEGLPMAQLLLLVNYRPEYTHSWGSKTYYTQLRLDPLRPESVDEFLAVLFGNDPSLEPLKKLLIERTEGNPFFLEESVRALVETRVLAGEPGGYRLVQDLPTIQVPATVQAVLAARIDSLPQDEKRLLQTAAVIGTTVPFALLQHIAEAPEAALYRGLIHLQATEFLYETSLFPEKVYTFKHTLTHETAYGSLLQERRRVLHARIVEAIETFIGARVAEQVERLAHHALRGEVWDKVLVYCRQAGQTATRRGAYQEAVAFYEQALHAFLKLPPTSEGLAQAIDLHLALQDVLFPLGAYPQSVATLREAEGLAEALGDQRRLGWVMAELSGSYRQIGAYDQAVELAQRAVALAVTVADDDLHAWAALRLGQVFYFQGDYPCASDGFREAIACSAHAAATEETTFLPTHARSWLIYCLAQRGEFGEGLALGPEAMQFDETGDYPTSRCAAYASCGYLSLLKGDLTHAIALLERGIDLCHRRPDLGWCPECATSLALAYSLVGRVANACPLLDQAVTQDATMAGGYKAIWLIKLGQSFLLVGRRAEARAQAEHAFQLSHERQERGFQAWALWLLGDIAAQGDTPEVAQSEASYHQALALATELGMRPLQAHCHRGLGTLYTQTGQLDQARVELSTAIDMYRDMEMTFWLPETQAALAELEGKA